MDVERLFGSLRGRLFELSHELTPKMPVYGPHPPYSITLHRRHGDAHPAPRAGGSSFANEQLVTSTHIATHIDALGHFSRNGQVHGGCPADQIETANGLTSLDASEIPPLVAHAVLLDIAGHRGVDNLEAAEPITGDELETVASGLDLAPGDVVLIRTGWARFWDDPMRFNNAGRGWPGPEETAAHWLIDRQVKAAGTDTPAFECIPSPGDSVHALLLVDHAIYIIENLNLEALAASGTKSFTFIALPLPIVGATGSPLRPIAIV